MTRIERLAAGLEQPLLVTSLVNVRYLTGFVSSNAAVLVDPAGEGTLYTDFRYAEAASDVDGVTFEEMPRALLAALAERLAGRRIGVEVVATAGAVEALRAVKDEGELELMRRAAAISDRVFEELAREPFVGRTETELAWWIEQAWHEAGADGASFSAVVAAGENGARPHAKPRDVRIPEGTLVVVDAGCAVDGYASDCTRTFFTGEPAGRARELYDLCLTAQLDGLAAVAPGADGREVDAASRVAIGEAGLAERYGHGLGHGVGLEVHELPTLRPESDSVLVAGNIVTVEPGLYVPGELGVRIEDMVLVTDDGCERLTTVTKEPVQVG